VHGSVGWLVGWFAVEDRPKKDSEEFGYRFFSKPSNMTHVAKEAVFYFPLAMIA
jgi:hypothetical protein